MTEIKLKTIRKEGYSRVVAITDIVPGDWKFITMELTKKSKDKITVIITKKS
jgi:phenylpyruvate tautomerase PptA (4-oxalocrotonate tautomerase family)